MPYEVYYEGSGTKRKYSIWSTISDAWFIKDAPFEQAVGEILSIAKARRWDDFSVEQAYEWLSQARPLSEFKIAVTITPEQLKQIVKKQEQETGEPSSWKQTPSGEWVPAEPGWVKSSAGKWEKIITPEQRKQIAKSITRAKKQKMTTEQLSRALFNVQKKKEQLLKIKQREAKLQHAIQQIEEKIKMQK